MSHPDLDPDLNRALQVLTAELGPLEVLDVHPAPPGRPPDVPALPPGPGPEPAQPGLFDPEEAPIPATTDPYSHIPPSRRWREVLRQPGPARSSAPPARRTA